MDPNYMDEISFRYAFLRRCLLKIPSISIDQICHCSTTQKVDGFGHHLLKCNQIITNNGKCQQIWAHNNFLDNFIDICRFNGVKVDKEILLRSFLNQIGDDNNKRMDAILKLPNPKGNGYIKFAVDATIISGITKPQENGSSGILHGNCIFNLCEKIKKDNYNNDCSANNIQYFTLAITKDGGLSNESYKLLEMIEKYGSTTLKRTKIQHNYFRKKLSIKVIIDQSKIVTEKINALIEHNHKNTISQMEEISNYLTDNHTFNFDFPLENPSAVINYNKTATEDFQLENLIDNDDNSTILDNTSIDHTYDNINTILNNNNNNIHIDNFGDDLETLSDNEYDVNNNNINVDDDDDNDDDGG